MNRMHEEKYKIHDGKNMRKFFCIYICKSKELYFTYPPFIITPGKFTKKITPLIYIFPYFPVLKKQLNA